MIQSFALFLIFSTLLPGAGATLLLVWFRPDRKENTILPSEEDYPIQWIDTSLSDETLSF